MEEIEVKVQRYLVNFVKSLPCYVNEWKETLQNARKPVQGLVNQIEQMRHVEGEIKDIEEFEQMRQRLLYKVYQGIEEELLLIKNLVDEINKVTDSIRNKLILFENETVKLNWNDENSMLIKGSASQPELELLLDYTFDFWIFFSSAIRNINSSLKSMKARDPESMNKIENSFKINLDCKSVTRLLAISQYIDNEKAIT